MTLKPTRMATDARPGASFITKKPDEPKAETGHSQARELRDLAFIALELFDIPVEQKLAEVEYKMTLRRLTFRHRLSEAIELVYPWLMISTYALLTLGLSARQQRQRRARADLEKQQPASQD